MKNFYDRLHDHLLSWLRGRPFDGDEAVYTPQDRKEVRIEYERLNKHSTMQVNYTTYDGRRAQDSFNPRTHADAMILGHEDADESGLQEHPFWYCRIIKIFSLNVRYVPSAAHTYSKMHHMHVLWIRWFGRDLSIPAGIRKRHLHTVGFVPAGDEAAFGFLDPAHILRGIHLIPAFSQGKTNELLGPSSIRRPLDEGTDWQLYYINW